MLETFAVNEAAPRIQVTTRGDLVLKGSGRKDIQAQFESQKVLQVSDIQNGFRFECKGDLDLEVPCLAVVEVEHVGGDAEVRDLQGELKITRVDGDLEMRDIATTSVNKVGGDLDIEHVAGDLAVNQAGGDIEIEDVSGDITLNRSDGDMEFKDIRGALAVNTAGGDLSLKRTAETVIGLIGGDLDGSDIQGSLTARRIGGDLDLDDLAGALAVETAGGDISFKTGSAFRANAGGDADIIVESTFPGEASLNAGGDISIRLPEGLQANLEIASGAGRIYLDLAGQEHEIRSLLYRLAFGQGGSRILLRAGGEVHVESSEPAAPTGSTQASGRIPEAPSFTGINPEEIEARVLASTRHVAEQIEAARQRLERRGISIPGLTRTPPQAPIPDGKPEPVGEDERLIILRMLQDKKITIEEAEQLLEALDAQDLTAEE